MEALSLDLYDEEARGKTEALQWKLAQELLARGLTLIIERDVLRLGARTLGAAVELHHLAATADMLFERMQS